MVLHGSFAAISFEQDGTSHGGKSPKRRSAAIDFTSAMRPWSPRATTLQNKTAKSWSSCRCGMHCCPDLGGHIPCGLHNSFCGDADFSFVAGFERTFAPARFGSCFDFGCAVSCGGLHWVHFFSFVGTECRLMFSLRRPSGFRTLLFFIRWFSVA